MPRLLATQLLTASKRLCSIASSQGLAFSGYTSLLTDHFLAG